MVRNMYRRSTGIVACLMAEALDVQGIHMPMKSRYGRYTPLAKTLQEDPSCQLCSVLQKYVLQSDLITIETNLRETDLPLLSTLRQKTIVMVMQFIIRVQLLVTVIVMKMIHHSKLLQKQRSNPQAYNGTMGVIVLSRQWKNVLYTPLLLDHKYKSKHVKPLNVTFAVPEPDEVSDKLYIIIHFLRKYSVEKDMILFPP
ncbi:hypothetical protein C0J52_12031 [Blattella germanica]|nr:hypothetical protein C0J52_12031 [Blattella germanica]